MSVTRRRGLGAPQPRRCAEMAQPGLAFGQAVIGPPGSGKTTYCGAMRELLAALGRAVAVVNLDPANDALPYPCAADIGELVTLRDVMEHLKLGPNGGLLYCMEYLEANADWLRDRLAPLRGRYVLFDCPGQVELYTHHAALRNVFGRLAAWGFRVRGAAPPTAPVTSRLLPSGRVPLRRVLQTRQRRRRGSLLPGARAGCPGGRRGSGEGGGVLRRRAWSPRLKIKTFVPRFGAGISFR